MNTTPSKLTLSYSVDGQGKFNHEVATIEAAVEIFSLHRSGMNAAGDFTFNDFGARDLGAVTVKDGKKVVATIAYNGRVTAA